MSLKWKSTTIPSLCLIGVAAGSLVLAPLALAQEKTDKPAAPARNASAPAKPAGEAKEGGGRKGRGDGAEKSDKAEKTTYDFELPGADGKGVPLSSFKGKTIVVVNLARNSSYNSQLAALEKLSESYKDKGLVVIGVPSDEFGAAEPGKDAEIQKFYQAAKVSFPVMAKSTLTGDAELPFYNYLTTGKGAPDPGPVHWNYTKFILDKTGKVVVRFGSDVAPDSNEFISVLEQVLDGSYKPKSAGRPGGGEGGGGGGDGPPGV